MAQPQVSNNNSFLKAALIPDFSNRIVLFELVTLNLEVNVEVLIAILKAAPTPFV